MASATGRRHDVGSEDDRLDVDPAGLRRFAQDLTDDGQDLMSVMRGPQCQDASVALLSGFAEAVYADQTNRYAHQQLVSFVEGKLVIGLLDGAMGASIIGAAYTETDALNAVDIGVIDELFQAAPGQLDPSLPASAAFVQEAGGAG
jgi:hypothetical protein